MSKTPKRVVNEEFKEAINNDPRVLEERKRIGEAFLALYQQLEGEAAMRKEGTPLQFHYAKYVALTEMAAMAAMAWRHQVLRNAAHIETFTDETTIKFGADFTCEDFLRNAKQIWDKFESSKPETR